MDQGAESGLQPFPAPYYVLPKGKHTHSVVFLHGLSWSGPGIADQLFSLGDNALPKEMQKNGRMEGFKWIFPTAATPFRQDQMDRPSFAWFQQNSLKHMTLKTDEQVDGLRRSVMHVLQIAKQEVEILGDWKRVYIGGWSMGSATAIWTICNAAGTGLRFGKTFAFGSWLPGGDNFESEMAKADDQASKAEKVVRFAVETMLPTATVDPEAAKNLLNLPFLACHGLDDEVIDIKLGRQVFRIMEGVGAKVEWKEYVGSEGDGHWIKDPEGVDYFISFLLE